MYITKKLNFKQVMYNDEQQIILGLNDLFTKELSGPFLFLIQSPCPSQAIKRLRKAK
jgi:hypothetical protein